MVLIALAAAMGTLIVLPTAAFLVMSLQIDEFLRERHVKT